MTGKHALAAALWLSLGCSSTPPQRYPGTDVLDVPGLRLERAVDLEQSGNTLQSGTIVYRGEGDLRKIFREYLQAMETVGWTTTYANYDSGSGAATLRKDKRIARLNFLAGKKKITASIQVSSSPTVESGTLNEAK